MNIKDQLTELNGVGPKTQKLFLALGISGIGDLLLNFPRTYQIFPGPLDSLSDAVFDEKCAVCACITGTPSQKKTPRVTLTIAKGRAGDTPVEFVWFNMPYVRQMLHAGRYAIFYGSLERTGTGGLKMQQPQIFSRRDYQKICGRPQPVYSLTKGLTNNAVKKAVAQVLEDEGLLAEYLPAEITARRKLCSRAYALRQIHFPDSFDCLTEARDRLVYDEFFDFFLRMNPGTTAGDEIENPWSFSREEEYRTALANLPYSLTDGQAAALSDITEDMRGEFVSQRMIQGDVGSGKTIIAFLAMLLAVENGCCAAIMAPTDVLARQHCETFRQLLSRFGLNHPVLLITGSVKGKARREADAFAASEKGVFLIGTHALFSEKMVYRDLALVITDEQHRFGVRQRKELAAKGMNPHTLVMSATPIPRSLAMILYGDMNISVIRDVPASRKPIKNSVIRPDKRDAAFRFIKKEVDKGHQAYVICPLVEASEKTEAENVTEYRRRMTDFFGGALKIGLLHGRMSAEEKNRAMKEFEAHASDILVSTTVVEVGVNVPNATVMLIENANRFGLAQLHQLRGRVGRGADQSYCMFMDSTPGKPSERLAVIGSSNDGFFIASEDLKSRGPGDFFGIRQSGEMSFKLADIYQDAGLMGAASEDAKALLAADPGLTGTDGRAVAVHLREMRETVYTNL